ncbi:NAD(P)-dependent dehydrogenase (short-subunit alcohol dehydrogenase family) [Neobacillus niacini]|jgi:NAD(P)-dependent dehydrogenase (short-subunit alcohol dehydrogenase family)|uniref:short chain dehydrogenase n=1 Tax=Neobacillus niacini TaxID=86668 RepID=UPI00277EA49E|nr:short chain dehydrogenase [Neobacillus niacini]MDQ0999664.1 NAD(P)-dependent dehydrogenase (short-subunit alcohol dehydrogenase family) [Neobacillus niacini]
MRILVVGANGTIGSAVVNEMKGDTEIIKASRSNSEIKVDITSTDSIMRMFEEVGEIDALVSTTGSAHFGPIEGLTPELNRIAVNSKLLGQINLVLLGLPYIRDKGSITLTTGILMDDPVVGGASSAMANGGIRAFVKSAAIELPRGIRINSVSPNMLEESKEKYGSFFVGFEPVPAKRVALAYRKSILGSQTGQSYTIY